MDLFKGKVKETGEAVASVFKSVRGIIDESVTSKEERGKILLNLKKAEDTLTERLGELVNERHKIDMMSDSWLSKNIRPLSLLIVFTLFIIILVVTYYGGVVDSEMIVIVKGWGAMMLAFYFGSRTLTHGINAFGNIMAKRKNRE